MKDNEVQAKMVALKLEGLTQPLLLEFAGWCLKNELYDEDMLKVPLTREWDSALPDELICDDLLADMRSFLYNLFEFALEKARKQERYDEGKEGLIHTEPNPYYDDSSCVTLHHPDSKTLVYHESFKTYYFDPKYLEDILMDAVGGIREGIGLIRKRLAEIKPFKCQECGLHLERRPDRCSMCGSERVY